MIEKSADGIENHKLIVHRRHLTDLREREIELLAAAEQQKIVVSQAATEVEKALEVLTEATKEWRTIEKHRENWRHEKLLASNRKEQKNNDETAAILHERNKIE